MLGLSDSFCNQIYGLHRSSSVHLINSVVFTQSFLVHSLLFLLRSPHGISNSYYNSFASALQILPLIEAAKDIVTLFIVHREYLASRPLIQ